MYIIWYLHHTRNTIRQHKQDSTIIKNAGTSDRAVTIQIITKMKFSHMDGMLYFTGLNGVMEKKSFMNNTL